ncbi:hypothetical protein [Micromonospora sp. NPDC002575]|uniref:hypothetical protein n=1 Tax=Micromonospora sp. NPDC002575 TaxID=3364222 RepID=UPI0036CF28F2
MSALVAQRRAAGSAARRPSTAARPASGGRSAKTGSPSSPSPTTIQPTTAPTSGGTGPEVVDPAVRVPVQRLAAGADAATVQRPGPNADPKFAALKADVRGRQQVLGAHPPASAEAARAQGAAKPPQDDREAQGKAANAEKMNAAKPGAFDKAAFIRAVNEAIAAQAPKNLDEADKFGDSGKADAVKGQVQGQVGEGKKASANAIETTTKAPPDTSKAVDKKVTPLVADKPPATPGAPDPAKAVPDKAPAAATDLSGGPKQVDQQMAEAQVTEEQLARSNEPEFTGALKEKNAAEQHAQTAPGQVRASEAQTLAGAKAAAGAAGATAMTALAGDRKAAGAQVGAGKEQARSADEAKRAKVTATLQKVFDATKKDVEEILSGLDKKVDEKFGAGERAARDAFTAEHKRRMDEYKDKRYSGIVGKGRWLKDKFAGLPEEANQIFVVARKGYVDRMQQVISGVADVIGAELGRAKQRIAAGRDELQAEVRKLPADLQAIGKEAAGEFAGRFDELTEQVNSKGTELVQTLASKYNEALKSVDEEIAAEKEKNKGLVAKAVDAVAGVIKTIMQLKDMLMGVLAKAAQAVAAIIKDPIGFLGNLVSAVGAGLKQFLSNIGEHLKKGLIGWLTGAMAGAGLELPAKFDLRGIVLMIGSLLGLTWASIRALIVKRGVPEPAMGAVEKSVPLVQKVQAQGLGGMWEEIQDKVGDLKANLFSKISEYLIPTVLMAGITWIISLLNPASAFVRAVKMIIDFVTFIVTQGAQIIEFVNSVLDAIIAIAGGGTGGVPALIEKALARSVPVLIGVLAAVLGVGGIAQRVQKFFKGLAAPVMKAVGWVADKIAAIGRKLWAKLKAKFSQKKKRNQSPDDQIKAPRERFEDARDEKHELFFRNEDPSAPLMIHSAPQPIDVYLKQWKDDIAGTADEQVRGEQLRAYDHAMSLVTRIEARRRSLQSGTAARQAVHNFLVRMLGELAATLAVRRSLSGPPLPEPLLPPFTDDVLATPFKASYINKNIKKGSPASANDGSTLRGWSHVDSSGYNRGANSTAWVKMHLLPAFLGGEASDSNLVPARGFTNNPLFLRAVENPARRALDKKRNDAGFESMVWYRVGLSYYATPEGFPRTIEVEWGGYDASGKNWTERSASGAFSDRQDPPAPPHADVLRINKMGTTLTARYLGISESDARAIKSFVETTPFRDIAHAIGAFPHLTTALRTAYQSGRIRFD